jgi:hypothetical protein
MNGDPYLFRQIMAAFETNRLRYCLLASYDRYPDSIASDVDFMVVPADAARVAPLLAGVAARSNARLVQCIQHETTAAWFVIARQGPCTISMIQPDLSGNRHAQALACWRLLGCLSGRHLHLLPGQEAGQRCAVRCPSRRTRAALS